MSPLLSILPQSQFKGESALGFYSKYLTARHNPYRVQLGVHYALIISKQTYPVSQWTFGWNILFLKCNLGGVKG